MNVAAVHVLYRLYDASGALLYIGITGNPKARFAQHAVEKPWWVEVDEITTDRSFISRVVLEEHERRAIIAEKPRYNKVFNSGAVRGHYYTLTDVAIDYLPPELKPSPEGWLEKRIRRGELRGQEVDGVWMMTGSDIDHMMRRFSNEKQVGQRSRQVRSLVTAALHVDASRSDGMVVRAVRSELDVTVMEVARVRWALECSHDIHCYRFTSMWSKRPGRHIDECWCSSPSPA